MNTVEFEKRVQQNEKYRELIEEMEDVIGGSCYNGNIQNYGPGGMWEGEGRWFRYPIKFEKSGSRKYYSCENIPAENLKTGHYAFGANELAIVKALTEIIELLENKYGLKLD